MEARAAQKAKPVVLITKRFQESSFFRDMFSFTPAPILQMSESGVPMEAAWASGPYWKITFETLIFPIFELIFKLALYTLSTPGGGRGRSRQFPENAAGDYSWDRAKHPGTSGWEQLILEKLPSLLEAWAPGT